MKQKGSKRVEIAGLSDKRMITAVVASTLSGDMHSVQLIYDGKSDRCHPKVSNSCLTGISHTLTTTGPPIKQWKNMQTLS